MNGLTLSLFPGLDLLGLAFEAEGFCVVRGPDPITAGDVRNFRPARGMANGIIAGSPCQDFSRARRSSPTGYGVAMLAEFSRIVREVQPAWWLLENVPAVPDVSFAGYSWQRIDVDAAWYGPQRRRRVIQFGSSSGAVIEVAKGKPAANAQPTVTAGDTRPLQTVAELQGLPPSFRPPGWTERGLRRAIGNGVPIYLGRELARAVRRAYGDANGEACNGVTVRRCGCACGRPVFGRAVFYDATCRKRSHRRQARTA